MTDLKFTHTTYGTEVVVFAEQVIAVMHLPTMKSTVLVGPGSTAIPVLGTVDEVSNQIKSAMNAVKPKEIKDGISKRKR